MRDRKSTRLNSSHTVIYTLSLHDALPIHRVGVTTFERAQKLRRLLLITPQNWPCRQWCVEFHESITFTADFTDTAGTSLERRVTRAPICFRAGCINNRRGAGLLGFSISNLESGYPRSIRVGFVWKFRFHTSPELRTLNRRAPRMASFGNFCETPVI